jgi:hypothetical protein
VNAFSVLPVVRKTRIYSKSKRIVNTKHKFTVAERLALSVHYRSAPAYLWVHAGRCARELVGLHLLYTSRTIALSHSKTKLQ